MANSGALAGRTGALPPVAPHIKISQVVDDHVVAEPESSEPHPISAFVCIIDYRGETRLINCRRYDLVDTIGYVGAICQSAGGYRQFRCDRIDAVFDATTGELIGDGSFFSQFTANSHRERAPTWGLTPSRRATLVAGLNVLAFMARCDGHWHPLESGVIEDFVCTMWLRKEWDGEPPLAEIIAHAQRLSPDSGQFFSALKHYAGSETSSRILRRAIGDLVAADGVICASEIQWGVEVDEFLDEHSAKISQEVIDAFD